MGEGIATAITEFFGIVTSGIGQFGTGLATGLADTAKNAFFTVSSTGAITGINAYAGVVGMGLAVSLAMSACYLVFNIL